MRALIGWAVGGLLDVILGYECNLACDYCTITPAMRARALPTPAVAQALARGRADGLDRVSFTGGEPTLRRDLVGLVRHAAALGYADVKVQSNGLLYAHAANVARLVRAGATRLHVSIHTHEAAAYDALVRRPESFELMAAGLVNAVASGLRVVADVILKEDTYRRLPAAIAWLDARGVRDVDLWYVSLTDGNAGNQASLPRMSDVTPVLADALADARARGMRARSLHVPRCLLGADHPHAFDPGADRVRVVTPDATFDLADSRLAGRVHAPACEGCEHRAICPGIRPDYLDVYGDGEIAAARGQAATISPTRLRVLT